MKEKVDLAEKVVVEDFFLDDDGGSGSFWLNLLEAVTVGTPGMKDGIPGKPGRDGRNGEINFVYY